jgi:hypothetical protein
MFGTIPREKGREKGIRDECKNRHFKNPLFSHAQNKGKRYDFDPIQRFFDLSNSNRVFNALESSI